MIKKYEYKIVEYDMQISAVERQLADMRDQGWTPISVSRTPNATFLVTFTTWRRN
jgi:hypothetical protein